MSPENSHKLMGIYMEVLILGVMVSASVSTAHFVEAHCKENHYTPYSARMSPENTYKMM